MAEKESKGIKKFFEEFKAFAMRGNVLDMAVGVVVGGAFTSIVNSLVGDIINPTIGLFFNADFSDVGIHVGDVMIGIGAFLNAVINFLIVAFVLFVVIKAINALHKKPAEPAAPAAPTTKVCPYCQSEISIKAVRCPPLHQQAGRLPGDRRITFKYKKPETTAVVSSFFSIRMLFSAFPPLTKATPPRAQPLRTGAGWFWFGKC